MPTFKHSVATGLLKYLSSRSILAGELIYSAKHRTTYFPPKKRNGGDECSRRIAQGKAGTCYVHGAQYL